MSRSLQLSIDSNEAVTGVKRSGSCGDRAGGRLPPLLSSDECAALKPARDSLKRQIARLECELGDVICEAFPHAETAAAADPREAGPRLLGLAELERERDMLVSRISEAKARRAERGVREAAAKRLLAAMKLEPGRYKFVRLRAADLGEGGCGVWQVRPRLGLIGMLAGWWQVKLSSGCPLSRGCVF